MDVCNRCVCRVGDLFIMPTVSSFGKISFERGPTTHCEPPPIRLPFARHPPSQVTMASLPASWVEHYVAHYHPLDKAGGRASSRSNARADGEKRIHCRLIPQDPNSLYLDLVYHKGHPHNDICLPPRKLSYPRACLGYWPSSEVVRVTGLPICQVTVSRRVGWYM